MTRRDATRASDDDRSEALPPLLVAWFRRSRRDLPWRDLPAGRRDPYRTLVSEAMLQQTQVSRVIEKFQAFIARFPTVRSLAEADERDVLALWAGLGYYRRARNLHAAAKHVMQAFGGGFPSDVESLRTLPGVGRYTAGAIASLAMGQPAPIVDGNVTRVLLRVHGVDLDQVAPATVAWAWNQAERFARAAAAKAGEANEAMMELGATVCTPVASPACERCPLAAVCVAKAERLQGLIPRPKKTKAPQARFMAVLLLQDRDGKVLCERRPSTGLWAGLWQPVTLEPSPDAAAGVQAWLEAGGDGLKLAKVTSITRTLTHRRVRIDIYRAAAKASWLHREIGPAEARASGLERRWATLTELESLGVSNAHHVAMHS